MNNSSAYCERRLAAIMFSDICGYSRMMETSEISTMTVLQQHNDILNRLIPEFGGRIIKRMGDGVMAEFPSAIASVECALEIQRTIAERNKTVEEINQFQLRIGLHLGDIIVQDDDIFGDGVNVASRIEPLAPSGGICISQDVYNQVHGKMDINVTSLGQKQLKNIEKQFKLYSVIPQGKDACYKKSACRWPLARTFSKRIALGMIGVAVLLFLVFGALLSPANRGAKAEAMLQSAKTAIDNHQFSKARRILKKATLVVPDKSGQIAQKAAEMMLELSEHETLARRINKLLKAWNAGDLELAMELLPPKIRNQRSKADLVKLMKNALPLNRLKGNRIDSYDIENIDIRGADQSAVTTIRCELRRAHNSDYDTSSEQKSADLTFDLNWKQNQDAWFLFPVKKQQASSKQPLRETLENKGSAFLDNLLNGKYAKALAFVDPSTVERFGRDAILRELKRKMGGRAAYRFVEYKGYELKKLSFDGDKRDRARAEGVLILERPRLPRKPRKTEENTMEIRKKSVLLWRRINAEWKLVIDVGQ